MTNQLLKALCLPGVTCAVFTAIPAHAAIFTATYTDTVFYADVDNVTAGNTAVITYQLDNRPRPNIISRPKVFLVKEYTRIKIILIASYFFSKIELATTDIHFSYRTA